VRLPTAVLTGPMAIKQVPHARNLSGCYVEARKSVYVFYQLPIGFPSLRIPRRRRLAGSMLGTLQREPERAHAPSRNAPANR